MKKNQTTFKKSTVKHVKNAWDYKIPFYGIKKMVKKSKNQENNRLPAASKNITTHSYKHKISESYTKHSSPV